MNNKIVFFLAIVFVLTLIDTAAAGMHDYHIVECDETCRYGNRLTTKVGGKGVTCQECCMNKGYESGQCNGTYGFLTRKCRCKPK